MYKYKALIFTVLLSALIACNSGTPGKPKSSVTKRAKSVMDVSTQHDIILPDGWVHADIMAPDVSEEEQELIKRYLESLGDNLEWYLEYQQQREAGEALPYHPNMGLTKTEYDELMDYMFNMEYEKFGETRLYFKRVGSGQVKIFSDDKELKLRNIIVDLDYNWVDTPYGRLDEQEEVDNDDPDSPTGPWIGTSWRMEQLDSSKRYGKIAKFALGHQDNKGVLYYDVIQYYPKQKPEKLILFLLYDDPRNGKAGKP